MALPIKTGKWVKATKVKVSKSGKIQLMVPGSSLKKNPRSNKPAKKKKAKAKGRKR